MDDKLYKHEIRLRKDQWDACDRMIEKKDMRSKSEFVREATDFYLTWLEKGNINEFLDTAIESVITAKIEQSEARLSRINFKVAVEIGVIAKILSAIWELNDADLQNFRRDAIRDVKETNGIIKVEDEF